MRNARVWHALLGVVKTVVEDLEFDDVAEVLVVQVRPARGAASRCGVCRRRRMLVQYEASSFQYRNAQPDQV